MPKHLAIRVACVLLVFTALHAQKEKKDNKILKNTDILLMGKTISTMKR